ncbi:thermonuclease family protein [Candidatus Daviesbacteria bacterium]|nr:thermonuclease family protein [Candidatus Daviesbacteria bacterium]
MKNKSMLSANQVKLIIVSVITLTLSGFLFYQGLKPQSTTSQDKESKISQGQKAGQTGTKEGQDASGSAEGQNLVTVSRVVDGDTIEVVYLGQARKLRYIGVNTPETVDPRRPVQCFGKEAADENKRLLAGKEVYLEKDISDTDKFGRLLRYVYLKLDDNTMLFINDYLVREGFAQVDTFPPDVKYQARFVAAQKEARENNRGLWARCKSV